MHVAGIVAEYNPFHTGHAYQIAQTKAAFPGDCAVVAVMSGNWVQQAHCAVADKWRRAQIALMGGVDLVLELPTVWATASAESFAWGAVSLLHGTGVVDVLSFGSEYGEVGPLEQVAACLDRPDCQERLHTLIGQGMSMASARESAVREQIGWEGKLLATPNNNLGIEYIRALRRLDSPITPMTVRREGAGHNVLLAPQEMTQPNSTGSKARSFVSATQLRECLSQGLWSQAEPYFVPGERGILEQGGELPSLVQIERAMLARVRTMSQTDWAGLPDSGGEEGLTQRLERAGRQCVSMEDFYQQVKTKRYTHARIRRLALWAYLGIRAQDIPAQPLYLRALAFNSRGRELLRAMKERAQLPIVTKPAHAQKLEQAGQALFSLESRCTDLYDLCFPSVVKPGREWTTGPVVMVVERKDAMETTGG